MGAGRKMSSVPKDKFPRLLNKLMKCIEPNASNNVKAGFKKCGIIPIDKEQVLKMLPSETISNENEANRQSHETNHIDAAFINFLKSMRYEDEETSGKKKTKVKIESACWKECSYRRLR